jgi:hypothetical protein
MSDDEKGGADAEGLSEGAADYMDTVDPLAEETPLSGRGGGLSDQELRSDAEEEQLRIRMSWDLIPGEVWTLLFANCLFFAGALTAWSRGVPGEAMDPAHRVVGIETIRGSLIFALSIYGFWAAIANIWGRLLRIKPYLGNAILALWVGIQGITSTLGSERWDKTMAALKALPTRTVYDEITYRLGAFPPGALQLLVGGIIVCITLIRGILAGAAKAKERKAAAMASRRKRD